MGDSGPGAGDSTGHFDAHDLGPQLQPALIEACNGQLSDVHWFRADWQMGGAATAYARFAFKPGEPVRDVVVKIPIGPREYRVTTALAERCAPTPRLAAHGREVGGYDFAWVVMERLPGNPLSAHLHPDVFAHLAKAAAGFYAGMAEAVPLEAARPGHDWAKLLDRSRESLRANPTLPHCSAWTVAVKHTVKGLVKLLDIWNSRAINTWCHGDLHPGNCMERPSGSPWGEPGYLLLDFAETHPGHWIEDAVYLERLYWGRPQALQGVKPVTQLAKARRDAGLDTSDDYGTLANVRRILMASTTPAFLHREGHPAYLAAALENLERLLTSLKL